VERRAVQYGQPSGQHAHSSRSANLDWRPISSWKTSVRSICSVSNGPDPRGRRRATNRSLNTVNHRHSRSLTDDRMCRSAGLKCAFPLASQADNARSTLVTRSKKPQVRRHAGAPFGRCPAPRGCFQEVSGVICVSAALAVAAALPAGIPERVTWVKRDVPQRRRPKAGCTVLLRDLAVGPHFPEYLVGRVTVVARVYPCGSIANECLPAPVAFLLP
jgi:hypothetical protein